MKLINRSFRITAAVVSIILLAVWLIWGEFAVAHKIQGEWYFKQPNPLSLDRTVTLVRSGEKVTVTAFPDTHYYVVTRSAADGKEERTVVSDLSYDYLVFVEVQSDPNFLIPLACTVRMNNGSVRKVEPGFEYPNEVTFALRAATLYYTPYRGILSNHNSPAAWFLSSAVCIATASIISAACVSGCIMLFGWLKKRLGAVKLSAATLVMPLFALLLLSGCSPESELREIYGDRLRIDDNDRYYILHENEEHLHMPLYSPALIKSYGCILSSDKTEYARGEEITLTLSVSVIIDESYYYSPDYRIEKRIGSEWYVINSFAPLSLEVLPITADSEYVFTVNTDCAIPDADGKLTRPLPRGEYRIVLPARLGEFGPPYAIGPACPFIIT